MPVKWKLFRTICLLQIIGTSLQTLTYLYYLFQHFSFGNFIGVLLFSLALSLAVLGLNLLKDNYPSQPVAGKQKSSFNWLFLLNFLFLAFFFGILFSELKMLLKLADLFKVGFNELPFSFLLQFFSYAVLLVFQLYILYFLFELRRELYFNFRKQEFEFEK